MNPWGRGRFPNTTGGHAKRPSPVEQNLAAGSKVTHAFTLLRRSTSGKVSASHTVNMQRSVSEPSVWSCLTDEKAFQRHQIHELGTVGSLVRLCRAAGGRMRKCDVADGDATIHH